MSGIIVFRFCIFIKQQDFFLKEIVKSIWWPVTRCSTTSIIFWPPRKYIIYFLDLQLSVGVFYNFEFKIFVHVIQVLFSSLIQTNLGLRFGNICEDRHILGSPETNCVISICPNCTECHLSREKQHAIRSIDEIPLPILLDGIS
jgi:hypothetical protein